jgi:hypothetical protein
VVYFELSVRTWEFSYGGDWIQEGRLTPGNVLEQAEDAMVVREVADECGKI